MTDFPADRHLSWERFESLIGAGPPAVERVAGQPRVDIFTDPEGSRIGVRIFSSLPIPDLQLAEIATRKLVVGGISAVELSTGNPRLYREFYAFACQVADGVQVNSLAPASAVGSALESWTALLEHLTILSPERQTGLLGELWVLARVAEGGGWEAALQAWKGPDAEEHDFSLSEADIEVKTTTSEHRIHMIGSLTQMLPEPGRPLYLLSLQFTQSGLGPGTTLAEAVAEAKTAVSTYSPSLALDLDSRLRQSGWHKEHAQYYRKSWSLRSAARLIAVDARCPAIVPNTLAPLGADRVLRIIQVSYRISVEGLGSPDGSPEFLQVLP